MIFDKEEKVANYNIKNSSINEKSIDVENNQTKIENKIEQSFERKGKLAICKIINNLTGIGFFCIIPLHDIKIKILFTNNHILNEGSLSIGNEIKINYKYQKNKIYKTKNVFDK